MLLAAFVGYERGRQDDEPLVPFSLFRDRGFSVVNVVGITVSFGIVGLSLPLTIYLQSVLGFSAQRAGLVMLVLAAGSVVSAGLGRGALRASRRQVPADERHDGVRGRAGVGGRGRGHAAGAA